MSKSSLKEPQNMQIFCSKPQYENFHLKLFMFELSEKNTKNDV